MVRERVIVEIQNLDQALKVEETIGTGYCEPIAENLRAWIAVEEDLIDSYEKLSEKFAENHEVKKAMSMLYEESRNNIKIIQNIHDSIEGLVAARDRRREIVRGLIEDKL